ncbi:hypothetical protein BASA81_017866 [Batrachochytrium salamandrivorans]|nr:hypothetical protein BASA81_017866 [Batrachochytrium salamandrivorans]
MDSKKAHYGPAADPFPIASRNYAGKHRIQLLTRNSNLALLMPLPGSAIITPAGTNMAPYRCFYATTGVTFTFIEGDVDITKKPTVVVTSTAKHPNLLALFGEDYSKIQVGDELLAINGLTFIEWFEKNQFTSGGGANEFGGQRAALE